MRSGSRLNWVALVVVLVMAIAAGYEFAVAVKWIPVGQLSGEGFFLAAGALAMLAGWFLALFLAVVNRRRTPGVALGAVAASLVAAHAYTFDTYDLPSMVRYTEAGAPSASWVAWVVGAGLLASLFCLLQPRIGFLLTALLLPVCLFTYVFTGCCN